MEKKILLIRKGKSFMLNTLVKNLTAEGYEIIEADPTTEDICDHKGRTDLILMFLGGIGGHGAGDRHCDPDYPGSPGGGLFPSAL